ncbi:hypothetical protein K3G39_20540 [Pontibacter sp. HSC-14F20]|uniref:hypothetical protein n=1 Tax=Pontibacter sp. HSC-14F20 TaxID=2864136 RepID=UPI001C736BF6|nr:hypothetical protein [Pontibacter sp. HSC-14F20]MBX0335619.1 hypothetical protein [Pontibacter sp. HSC-14F20]
MERWHLVLKGGVKVERLQVDSFRRLSNAIALLSLVAWQLLWLKKLAAQAPELAAQAPELAEQRMFLSRFSCKYLSSRQARRR